MSKKAIALILSLALILMLCPAFGISANAAASGDYTYEVLQDGTAVITDYDGMDSVLEIPSEIGGYTVTAIGDSAFFRNYFVEEIILPDTVKKIGTSAFANSISVTSVSIPDGVTEIGSQAFSGMPKLYTVHIPDSVTQIGDYAFGYLYITDQYVPVRGFTVYGNDGSKAKSFAANNGFIFKEDGIVSGDYHYILSESGGAIITGYEGAGGNVLLPNAFDGHVVFEIADYAFAYCDNIQSVILSSFLRKIGDYAFMNCTYISSVLLTPTLLSVGKYAFCNIPYLTEIRINRGLGIIGEYAFGSFLYEDPDTGEMVTEMGSDFFTVYGYPETAAEAYAKQYGLMFNYITTQCGDYDYVLLNDDTAWIAGYYGEETDLDIPESLDGHTVTGVAKKAFLQCDTLRSVRIPSSVKRLYTGAFYLCANLEEVTFSEGLERIDALCFENCTKLRELQLPRSLKTLQEYSFGLYEKTLGDLSSAVLDDDFRIVAFYDTVGTRYCGYYGIPYICYRYGDVDVDGKVDIFDASSIQKSIAGMNGYVKYNTLDQNGAAFLTADVDGNGVVDIFDASLIQKNVAGSTSAQGYGIGEWIQ